MWEIEFSRQALKDIALLKAAGLDNKVKTLLAAMRESPYQNPPPYEKLRSYDPPQYSRRINRQHRLLYVVLTERKIIRVLRMWTHYSE